MTETDKFNPDDHLLGCAQALWNAARDPSDPEPGCDCAEIVGDGGPAYISEGRPGRGMSRLDVFAAAALASGRYSSVQSRFTVAEDMLIESALRSSRASRRSNVKTEVSR